MAQLVLRRLFLEEEPPALFFYSAHRTLGFNCYFQHTVAMLGEKFIGVGYLIQLESMGKQWFQVQSLVQDHLLNRRMRSLSPGQSVVKIF